LPVLASSQAGIADAQASTKDVTVPLVTKFKWRALWFLVGTPLAGWWVIALYLIALGCAHNIKNCP
jgi:hypothetical protein